MITPTEAPMIPPISMLDPAASDKKSKTFFQLRKAFYIFLIPSLCALLAIGIYYYIFLTRVLTVIPNQIYRSAQLNTKQLESAIAHYHLASVINLRGPQPDSAWYIQELNTSMRYKVRHFDVSFDSKAMPAARELKKLVTFIETAPKPLLLHCLRGADRTGLAAAISKILLTQDSLEKDLQQFSWYYLALAPNSIGKLLMPRYQLWLQQNKFQNNAVHFKQWVNTLDA